MRYYSTAPFVEALDINVFRIFSQRLLAAVTFFWVIPSQTVTF
jgi:hypothetical protein